MFQWFGFVYNHAGQTKFFRQIQSHHFVIFASISYEADKLYGDGTFWVDVIPIHHYCPILHIILEIIIKK